MKATKAKSRKRGAGPPTAVDGSLEKAASDLGVSSLALRLFAAAGCPSPLRDEYDAPVASLAECAKALGVSERALPTWKSKGMPCDAAGYRPVEIREWRRSQDWPEPPGAGGMPRRQATGDLFRAVFRMLRAELTMLAAVAAGDVVAAAFREAKSGESGVGDPRPAVALAVRLVVEARTRTLTLSDAQIERLLEEVWFLV